MSVWGRGHGGAVNLTGPLAESEEQAARERLRGFQTKRKPKVRKRPGARGLSPGVWARDYPDGCIRCQATERNHHSRGLCSACYHSWTSHGKPTTPWGSPDLSRFPAAVPREVRR